MDKIFSTLIIGLMTVLEVNLTLIEYMLCIMYLMYMSFRGKRNFKKSFVNLNKDFVDTLIGILKHGKTLIVKA